MVRINLLDDPIHFSSGKKTPEEQPAPQESSREDFSFDSMEKMFHPEESDESGSSGVEAVTPAGKEENSEADTDRDFAEKSKAPVEILDEFDSTLPKKKLFVIGGVVAVVLILAISLYFMIGGSGNEGTPSEIAGTTERPAAQTLAGSKLTPAPGPFQNVLADNRNQNSQHLKFVSTLVGSGSSGTGYSLIITTADRAYFSILAKNRDEIARFRIKIKKEFPGVPFSLESIQSKMVDGKQMLLADFGTDLKPVSGKSALSRSVKAGNLTTANIRSLFNGMAGKYRLRTKYFKQGYRVPGRLFTRYYYYATLSGKKAGIVQFLEELNRNYPELNFAKISIYPANLSVMDNAVITARITFILFAPAKS